MTRRAIILAAIGLAITTSACAESSDDADDSPIATVAPTQDAPSAPDPDDTAGTDPTETDPTGTDPAGTDPTGTEAADTGASGGGIGGAIEIAAGAPGEADAAACDIDRRTLETASQMYEALTGAPPASQTDLIDRQLIQELSPRFEISDGGSVVAIATGPCA